MPESCAKPNEQLDCLLPKEGLPELCGQYGACKSPDLLALLKCESYRFLGCSNTSIAAGVCQLRTLHTTGAGLLSQRMLCEHCCESLS